MTATSLTLVRGGRTDLDRSPFAHFGRAVERTVDSLLENAYNVDRKLLLERNRLALLDHRTYRDVRLYEAVRPARGACFDAGSYLFFDRAVLAAMREAGRQSAEVWLATGPRVDRIDEPEDAHGAAPSGRAQPEPMTEGISDDGGCGRAIEVLEVEDRRGDGARASALVRPEPRD